MCESHWKQTAHWKSILFPHFSLLHKTLDKFFLKLRVSKPKVLHPGGDLKTHA